MSWRYACNECGKTYIGEKLPGSMTCLCSPPRSISGQKIITPLSAELLTSLSIHQATVLRGQLCADWGIENKSHATHGSNFAGNQTVVQLIHNILTPVTGAARDHARQRIRVTYGYDPDAREMTF
jgi:hypothetical protein